MSEPLPPFRRRLVLSRPTPTTVAAELEDHIHHVVVTVEHVDGVVTAIDGQTIRIPWSLCPGAIAQLAELVGTAVGTTPTGVDGSTHCTHLLDCATSAIRFAGTDAASRRFDIVITDGDQPVVTSTARRDDGVELVLETDGRTILQPEPYAGHSLGAGLTSWASRELDVDQAELLLLLRRATWMRVAPAVDLDSYEVLGDSGVSVGSCFSSQPARINLATRNRGSSLDPLAS